MLPILYQSGFNTEGFPNLEDYLYQTVGSLPCQSLLRLALDSVFEEFPEISAIQTKVYRMLKCHLSIINHSSITQFDDISLSNHDFDRVAGPDFHNISGTESRPDLLLQTDFNDTYYSVYSQAQRQVCRVTDRSLCRLRKDRANSCPDIVQQLNRDSDHLSNSNWRYTTAHEPLYPDPYYLKNDQQTQTEIVCTLQVKDTGAQYSSPSDSSDTSSSESDSDIEGTENITVAKRYLHRHSVSSEDLYTNPTLPNKRFRTSTPDPPERRPEKEPLRCLLKEIINHRPALHIPPVDLTVAPGVQAANVQCGRQQVNAMAGRGRNPPQPQALQGADPALVQILQMMQNRDANRDNSRKQFLMFPKDSFTGEDKKKAKSHWAEFSKYLDYQNQQGTIPRDLAHLPEIKSMFKLTLQDIALGWFDTESPNWLTEDQMKQTFLKRFNPWGDTRRQQQDAWNKLKFDMTKDDVDAFVVDMKMLASILGHNDDVITEKFKDIFPDLNIKAALIAMDNFAAMQTKAKQLVQIYKPAHDSPVASAAILVHTTGNSPTKSKSSQPKSNQHQLAPINQTQDNPNTGDTEYNGGQCGRGRRCDRSSRGRGNGGNSDNRYDNQDRGAGRGQGQWDFQYNRGRGQDSSFEVNKDNGMEMTSITVTETTGTEIPKVKEILTGVEDGIIIIEVKDIVIGAEGEDGIPISTIMIQGINNKPNFQTQIIIIHHLWDISIGTQSHMSNTHTPSNNNNNINPQCRQLHHNKPQICVSCVIIKEITIISANLQATLWPEHKKPLVKADHTATKTRITGNGHMATMMTMTLMGNLFSSGGSRCR